jgi:hypothetical protein
VALHDRIAEWSTMSNDTTGNRDRLSILQSAQGNPALVALAAVNIAHDSLHV